MTGIHNLQKIKTSLVLSFGFTLCVLCFTLNCFALNIDKVKVYFLNGDYKSAILEGEKILASQDESVQLDELYYILGLSYLKDGNFLRASDIFEIILSEFKNSSFMDEAKLGLGDTYFLRRDYDKAQEYYNELINTDNFSKLRAALYYRLSQIGFKNGDTQQAREYMAKLKHDFPSSLEGKMNGDSYLFSEIYYTVQVGSFANASNARRLCGKLTEKGYNAYLQEAQAGSVNIYRVRVGKLKLRSEAVQLEKKLSTEGYSTKIFP